MSWVDVNKNAYFQILFTFNTSSHAHDIVFIIYVSYFYSSQAWPEDALQLVAHKFLDDVEMSQEVRENAVVMCQYFHQSVRALSEK